MSLFSSRDEVADRFGEGPGIDAQLRQAVVTAIDSDSPFVATIEIGGSAVSIEGVRSLTPVVVGDTVWCVRQDTDLVIVGHLDTGWRYIGTAGAPAFQNSWTNHGAAGNPLARIRKVGGIVWMRGLIKNGLMAGASAFTLEVGWRPADWLFRATASNNAYGQLEIGPAGQVNPTVGSNTWFSLECSFVAEQ